MPKNNKILIRQSLFKKNLSLNTIIIILGIIVNFTRVGPVTISHVITIAISVNSHVIISLIIILTLNIDILIIIIILILLRPSIILSRATTTRARSLRNSSALGLI
jgi:hypothetical protein